MKLILKLWLSDLVSLSDGVSVFVLSILARLRPVIVLCTHLHLVPSSILQLLQVAVTADTAKSPGDDIEDCSTV